MPISNPIAQSGGVTIIFRFESKNRIGRTVAPRRSGKDQSQQFAGVIAPFLLDRDSRLLAPVTRFNEAASTSDHRKSLPIKHIERLNPADQKLLVPENPDTAD
jgi:hypothetical protein